MRPNRQRDRSGNHFDPATATATGNCGGSPTATCAHAAPPTTCTGNAGSERPWNASGGGGTLPTCVQPTTFVQTSPTTITCPSAVTAQCSSAVPVHDFS